MTAHIFVIGFVQGVGFRRFIQKKAKVLGVTGWIKNTPDQRVEILAQGTKQQIDELKKIAEKGNIFSDVKGVVVDFVDEKEKFETFAIIF